MPLRWYSPYSPSYRAERSPAKTGSVPSGMLRRPSAPEELTAMRWFHIVVIALFAIATLIFVVQNFATVTMSFLGFSARTPLAVLVALFYILGMATGSSLWALLRKSFEGASRTP